VIGDTLHPDARRFRVTAHPMAPVVALDAALAMLHDAGPAAVEDAVLALARRIAAGLDAAGFRRYGPDEVLSGIVTVDHHDAAGARERLRDRGIRVSVRDRRLRFSPHAYNTVDEADAAVAALVDA
jgi:selenocysteine lyase/cysteine desulfurase